MMYDLAISFASADSEKADKIFNVLSKSYRVFKYNQSLDLGQNFGRDLPSLLKEVYLYRAKFCIILFSENYLNSQFCRKELNYINYRRAYLHHFVLPILVDEKLQMEEVFPGMIFLNFYEADLLNKLVLSLNQKFLQIEQRNAKKTKFIPLHADFVKGHKLIYFSSPIIVTDGQFTCQLEDLKYVESVNQRLAFANNLRRCLNFQFNCNLGCALTAWVVNQNLYLSTLPDSGIEQKTLVFYIDDENFSLECYSYWIPDNNPGLGALDIHAFHKLFNNLFADRSNIPIRREARIYYLECLHHYNFSFPVVPFKVNVEKFCGFVESKELPLYDYWDRNPRLVDGSLGVWESIYNEYTGIGILVFSFIGSWSNEAIDLLSSYANKFFGRRVNFQWNHGMVRVSLFLSAYDKLNACLKVHVINLNEEFKKVYAIIYRMIAAERNIKLPACGFFGREQISDDDFHLFTQTIRALGKDEIPSNIKDYPGRSSLKSTSVWSKFRHSPSSDKIVSSESRLQFSFDGIATDFELVQKMISLESELCFDNLSYQTL